MAAAPRRRLRLLPRDMSLVGFDDVPWMEMVDPGITVIAQPTADLGRRAASLLLRRSAEQARPRTWRSSNRRSSSAARRPPLNHLRRA